MPARKSRTCSAYCQLVNNPRDDMAFERTVNTPPRGIGRKTIERLTEHAYRYGMPLLEAARAACEIEGLSKGAAGEGRRVCRRSSIASRRSCTATWRKSSARCSRRPATARRSPAAMTSRIRTGWRTSRNCSPTPASSTSRIRAAASSKSIWNARWLVNETDNWDTETDKATLMTLHAAKGLEFPVVFIVAVEDGVLPHERVGQHPDELEEERRLAFVGITRAKEELQLSYAVTRDFRGVRRRTIPSSFLMEMPRDEMEMVDAAGAFDAAAFDPWDEPDDDDGDDSWEDWQIEDVVGRIASGAVTMRSRRSSVAAASIKTAAALSRESDSDADADAAAAIAARLARRLQARHDRHASRIRPRQDRGPLRLRQEPPRDDPVRDRRPEEDHSGAQRGAAGAVSRSRLILRAARSIAGRSSRR